MLHNWYNFDYRKALYGVRRFCLVDLSNNSEITGIFNQTLKLRSNLFKIQHCRCKSYSLNGLNQSFVFHYPPDCWAAVETSLHDRPTNMSSAGLCPETDITSRLANLIRSVLYPIQQKHSMYLYRSKTFTMLMTLQ